MTHHLGYVSTNRSQKPQLVGCKLLTLWGFDLHYNSRLIPTAVKEKRKSSCWSDFFFNIRLRTHTSPQWSQMIHQRARLTSSCPEPAISLINRQGLRGDWKTGRSDCTGDSYWHTDCVCVCGGVCACVCAFVRVCACTFVGSEVHPFMQVWCGAVSMASKVRVIYFALVHSGISMFCFVFLIIESLQKIHVFIHYGT